MHFPQKTLADWLAHCEQLHPKTIDLGLARSRTVAERLGLRFTMPVITVAGTNGKGSTCAMLEAILLQAGYRTGVYTSPHLVHFEERCRLRGEAVNEAALLPHFEAVEAARLASPEGGAEVSLSYFEFTTLAILRCLAEASLDVVILEVGLGGRLDTVNLVDADCAIVTSIDLDHTELLGPDRERIGFEKAGIFRSGQLAVISDPMPPDSVLKVAADLGCDVWRLGVDYNFSGDQLQWAWSGRGRRYSGLAYPALRGANQLLNASGVLAALTGLRARLPVTAQAVRNGLAMVSLPGRFQIVPGQPALVLDVAHNPHSVAALTVNLDAMGFYPRTHAVLGAMADKDLSAMLARVAPLVDVWYFCDLPTPRAASAEQLAQSFTAWQSQAANEAERQRRVTVACFKNPQEALDAAALAADPADRIVVFGSFYTVGGVLQNGVPKLSAKHLSN